LSTFHKIPDGYVTVNEIAQRLEITYQMAYNLVNKRFVLKKFPWIGKGYLYLLSDVESLVEKLNPEPILST